LTAADWALAAVLAMGAAVSLRIGLRQWRNVGRPFSYWLRNSVLDAESRAGHDRGILVFGVMCAFLAAIFVLGAVGGPHLGRGIASFGILVALAGMLVSLGFFISIMYFNRPRFLVPPHLRGELGAIAGRRRRRRDHLPMT
jgi:hypothetical protein